MIVCSTLRPSVSSARARRLAFAPARLRTVTEHAPLSQFFSASGSQ